MYSNAKSLALCRDLSDRLNVRLSANAGLNTITESFYVDANNASWPVLTLSHNGNVAEGQPVVMIEISNVDMVSKDIFGNQTFAYAPHVLQLGYELSAAPASYVFTVTSANATAGALYQDSVSGHQFLIGSTLVAGTTLISAGNTGNPAASGTLNRVSGTGDATITYSVYASQALAGATQALPAHADLAIVQFEAQTCGCEYQLKEIANGTAVTPASLNAAVASVDIQPLYWPTKSV